MVISECLNSRVCTGIAAVKTQTPFLVTGPGIWPVFVLYLMVQIVLSGLILAVIFDKTQEQAKLEVRAWVLSMRWSPCALVLACSLESPS